MADQTEIKVDGLEDVMKRLQSLATDGQERAVNKALRAAAAVEQAAITAAAPVNATGGGTIPAGALKADIGVTIKRPKGGSQYAVIGPGKYTKFAARMTEYGHRMVTGGRLSLNKKTGKTKGPGVQVGHVPEHPFIRPAFEQSKQEVVDVMTQTFEEALQVEVQKGGK